MESLITIKSTDELKQTISAIYDTDIELHAGETILITGILDAHDVTFINLLLGTTTLPGGGVSVFGNDTTTLSKDEIIRIKQRISVVFEDATLISNLKVVENVELPMQYHTNMADYDIMEKALSLLAKVDYRDNIWKLPGTLPFYTRKKIAVARAMALDPAIIIYDSIYKGLYSHELQQLIDYIIEFNKDDPQRLSIFTTSSEHNEFEKTNIKFDRIINLRVLENNG